MQADTRLVITGLKPEPVEVVGGKRFPRDDLRKTQEEADVILVHQTMIKPSVLLNVMASTTFK